MKILTTQDLILNYLKKHNRWFFGGELERIPTIHKPSTISRVLREMAEFGVISKDYQKVGKVRFVVYKFKKQ